ncbi:MAG: recombinase family protein [bacterium]|nr:recombinase family protein [bacterium]
MILGYARVSTKEQNLDFQIEKLEQFGCERIFHEKISATKERPELEKIITIMRPGDKLVVWKLDRLGRSLRHLVALMNQLEESKVDFVSIVDNIDTTTAQGRLTFNLFASFAEFERELISERTKAGLEAARRKGHFAGRPRGLNKKSQQKAWAAHALAENPQFSVKDITKQLEISRATYYRYVYWADEQIKLGKKKVRQAKKAA